VILPERAGLRLTFDIISYLPGLTHLEIDNLVYFVNALLQWIAERGQDLIL
jgi:hypothetical protein